MFGCMFHMYFLALPPQKAFCFGPSISTMSQMWLATGPTAAVTRPPPVCRYQFQMPLNGILYGPGTLQTSRADGCAAAAVPRRCRQRRGTMAVGRLHRRRRGSGSPCALGVFLLGGGSGPKRWKRFVQEGNGGSEIIGTSSSMAVLLPPTEHEVLFKRHSRSRAYV